MHTAGLQIAAIRLPVCMETYRQFISRLSVTSFPTAQERLALVGRNICLGRNGGVRNSKTNECARDQSLGVERQRTPLPIGRGKRWVAFTLPRGSDEDRGAIPSARSCVRHLPPSSRPRTHNTEDARPQFRFPYLA